MQLYSKVFHASIFLSVLFIILLCPLDSFSRNQITINEQKASDTVFKAIDLTYVEISDIANYKTDEFAAISSSKGVEPSPFIWWRSLLTGISGVRITTLNSGTGAQMGNRLQVTLPTYKQPVDILWARHFTPSIGRGIEPSPWVLAYDYTLYTFAITHEPDGTPSAGSLIEYTPYIDSVFHGHAVCMAELPGSEFTDGKARLFIGTDLGHIAVLTIVVGTGIIVNEVTAVSSTPITKLEPIPQYGYIALGVATENRILGIRYIPVAPINPFSTIFTLTDIRKIDIDDFDTFEPHDTQLSGISDSAHLVLANGTADLALSSIVANQTGYTNMNLNIDTYKTGVRSVAAGSLLMLADDEASVQYDLAYSPDSGFSGCDVDITDSVPDICGYICGDANGNGIVNIQDITFLINFLYKGGASPNPLQAGDANASGLINIQDITYLINYLYKQGAPPNCP
jgi:hypothetical protein